MKTTAEQAKNEQKCPISQKNDTQNAEKAQKSAIFKKILYAYNTARMLNLVKSQKDFAALLGLSKDTINGALNERDGYLTDRLLETITERMLEHGVDITNGGGTQIAGANFVAGGEQKILSNDNEKWFCLVAEKDKQIDRLLGIIENMQK